MVLFMLLSGYSPFDEEASEQALFEQIQQGACDTSDPVWLDISADAKDLVVRSPPPQGLLRAPSLDPRLHESRQEQAAAQPFCCRTCTSLAGA